MMRLFTKPEEPQTAVSPQKETVVEAAVKVIPAEQSSNPIALYAAQRKHAALLRRLSKAHLAVSLAPWLNLAFFTLFAFAARLNLGHWPRQMENLNGDSLDVLWVVGPWLLQLCMVGSLPIWLFLSIWRALKKQEQHLWRPITIFTLGWVTNLVLAHFDPVGFLNWFMD